LLPIDNIVINGNDSNGFIPIRTRVLKFIVTILLFLSTLSLGAQNLKDLSAQSVILMDYQTGRVLYEKNVDQPYPPASMTKLITLYLTYEAIEKGQFEKDEIIKVSPVGSSFSRPLRSSLMLLEEGQEVSILTLMQGVAISSGNDGAYQLAELVAGTPAAFIQKMNQEMDRLRLTHMKFYDPDGWSEFNQVTARELALFIREYIHRFPEALEELHSVEQLTYPQPENIVMENNPQILQGRTKKNTNLLLGEIEGVDGLKTGYIDESGFNFSVTAQRGQTRFIGIVMGIFTDNYYEGLQERADEAAELLEFGFDHWETRYAPDSEEEILLWMAEEDTLSLRARNLPLFTLTEEELARLNIVQKHVGDITAPVDTIQTLGYIQWYLDGVLMGQSELCAEEAVERASFWNNLLDFFPRIFYKISQGRDK